MALAMLRVLHVAAMTSASGRGKLSTSKSLSQKKRSAKVDIFGLIQTRECKIHYVGEIARLGGTTEVSRFSGRFEM